MINKSFILGLIIGIVLSGGIVYAATSIASSNVTYTGNSQSTVEGALNDLYTKSRYGDAGGINTVYAKNSYLHTIDNPTGASGTLTIKMQHTTNGSDNHGKHEFIVLSK